MRNLACVACEPVDDGHRRLSPPSAHDMVTAALGRIGTDPSATEAFRARIAQAADTNAIRAVLVEALRRVDALAGPDCSQEIERLRHKAARHASDAGGTGEAQRLKGLVAAQQARSDWLTAHPEVVTYLHHLTQRLRRTPQSGSCGTVMQPAADVFRSAGFGPDL